jgi:hypothetical protein
LILILKCKSRKILGIARGKISARLENHTIYVFKYLIKRLNLDVLSIGDSTYGY